MSRADVHYEVWGGSRGVFAWRARVGFYCADVPSRCFHDVGFRLSRRWV
jgi:hypothetical protein